MPTFQEDIDTDNAAVFIDASGDGFAEAVTYRSLAGVETNTNAVVEEQIFAITDDKQNKKFTLSAVSVPSPDRGGKIIHNSETWTILDVQAVEGLFELRCVKPQLRS